MQCFQHVESKFIWFGFKISTQESTPYWEVFRRSQINKDHSSRNSGGIHSSPNTAINSQGGEGVLLDDPNYFKEYRKTLGPLIVCTHTNNRFDFWKTWLFNCSIIPAYGKRFLTFSTSRINCQNNWFFNFHYIKLIVNQIFKWVLSFKRVRISVSAFQVFSQINMSYCTASGKQRQGISFALV